MILLDTNVLSELLRPAPEGRVLTWIAAQPRATLFTTSVTRGEMLYGIKVLPDGRRQQGLLAAILAIFNEELAGQVLNFDSDAADAYAEIAALRRSLGKPISQFDAMIAAIARSRGAHLATRNVKDFVECGIDIVDPWG
ncbi:type II toxin-antitoxin system VapC family toxin [Cupriavidus sp. D39]|uniref:type II toxin-antitoxin system VapC family toxin n=1 Tax=Cupriavidus sp. D39 TaxID=2997877 RepID=UPI0022709E8E|nr:type II toxin-antitoxin system VapC family toxin [Cupriavidus sp. D39]MCY0855699.1 type II toxin-antitoxin system VapC family toxin [Cupriavidus sp. D39]